MNKTSSSDRLFTDQSVAPPSVPRGTSGEIAQLTGLRGIAACDVMLSHFNGPGYPLINAIQFSNQAVDLFFCLSSFILCVAYSAGLQRAFPTRKFFIARLARIYPLYFVVFVFMGVVFVRLYSGSFSIYPSGRLIPDIFRQMLMINAWPIIGNGVHWNVAAWSVSAEAFCYLLIFPVLFALSTQMARAHWTVRAGMMVAVALVSGYFGSRWFDPRVATWGNPPASTVYPYWSPAARGTGMFIVGWLAYLSYLRQDWLAQKIRQHTDLVALIAVGLFGLTSLHLIRGWFVLATFAPLILGLMTGGSATAKLLASRPIHFLGMISYSIYLLHFPVLYTIFVYLPPMSPFTLFASSVVSTLVLSTISYYFLEEPSRSAIRRWLGGKRRTSMVAAAGIAEY
jgi:peptidoglycan/LPS O-acetylase OafA/YrhL